MSDGPFGAFDPPPPLPPSGSFEPVEPLPPGAAPLEPEASAAPPPPFGRPSDAPAPPSPEALKASAPPPAGDYLSRRLESLERELQAAQRHAIEAQARLRHQEELKSQVEAQLQKLADRVRRERAEKDTEELKARAEGRVDVLEKRLDEMHTTWAGLVREAIAGRESSARALEKRMVDAETRFTEQIEQLHRGWTDALQQFQRRIDAMQQSWGDALRQAVQARESSADAAAQELRQLRTDVAALSQSSASVPQLMPILRELEAQLPAGAARWEEVARQLAAGVTARLEDIERRMAEEMERQRLRLGDLGRERAALDQAIETQRHQIQQEFLKERLSLLQQFNDQSAKLQEALERVLGARAGEADQVGLLKTLVEKFERMLADPPHAKDQVLRELEAEKRDLLNALKERNAQFHAFTLERRDVERSLGESLLQVQRELDEARAQRLRLEARIAEQQRQVEAAESRAELARREGEEKDRRFATLAAERDELAKALMAEAEKVRQYIERLTEADVRWAAKLEESGGAAAQERQLRVQLESDVADLRARLQTAGDHLTRALQEKDLTANQTSAWKQEKEELLAALRKKDEMIAMLSSTFKNLIKK